MGQYKLFFDEVIFLYHRKKGNYYLCIILAIWSHFGFRSAIKVRTRELCHLIYYPHVAVQNISVITENCTGQHWTGLILMQKILEEDNLTSAVSGGGSNLLQRWSICSQRLCIRCLAFRTSLEQNPNLMVVLDMTHS